MWYHSAYIPGLFFLSTVEVAAGFGSEFCDKSLHNSNGLSLIDTSTRSSNGECRRGFLAFLLSSATVGCTGPSWAFENKISTKYDDRPKRRGPMVSWIFEINLCLYLGLSLIPVLARISYHHHSPKISV